MFLSSLEIHSFRNIEHLQLKFSDQFNIFYGGNGSGKTTLLEAIHHLSLARSFRTRTFSHVINHNANEFTVFGRIGELSTGVSRVRGGKLRIRISDKDVPSPAELAANFPIQLINPDTYQLITAGPQLRRQFIDWGVFHVEHEFLSLWKQMNRILKQRNAALKMGTADNGGFSQQFEAWNAELVDVAEKISTFRRQYVDEFRPVFLELVGKLLNFKDIKLDFSQGWPEEEYLSELLARSFRRDLFLGHTYYGAHRADLLLKIGDRFAQDIMSRGQLKLVVCAMQLAQAILLEQTTGKKCIFLIDDLPSELDSDHRRELCLLLMELKTQVFMTGIEKNAFSELLTLPNTTAFHINEGLVVSSHANLVEKAATILV